YCREPIVLDGGNVVASRTRVILTDKIYRENPSVEQPRLRKRLEELFQAECIFIPKEPYDSVDHADGVVRFVAEDRVLVNDYSGVDPGYGVRVRNLLEKKGLEVETLPLFEEKGKRRPPGKLPPAVGIYINFLRVGDVVVLPGYDRPEDQAAVEKVVCFRQVCKNLRTRMRPADRVLDNRGVILPKGLPGCRKTLHRFTESDSLPAALFWGGSRADAPFSVDAACSNGPWKSPIVVVGELLLGMGLIRRGPHPDPE
ncbi:MAG TPA: agmatine deiminase family protein, partial [Gemmataceae bacterium]